MTKRLLITLALLLTLSRPSWATAITGVSYDGNPPGNLSQITGVEDFLIGHDPFPSGIWQITWDGGITGWRDSTTISALDMISEDWLFTPGDVTVPSVVFTMLSDWVLSAQTPSLFEHSAWAQSPGPQWAFWSTPDGAFHWALEDIALDSQEPVSDRDYQDAYGTLTNLTATLQDAPLAPLATPEPSSVGLVCVPLAWILRRVWRRS